MLITLLPSSSLKLWLTFYGCSDSRDIPSPAVTDPMRLHSEYLAELPQNRCIDDLIWFGFGKKLQKAEKAQCPRRVDSITGKSKGE